MKVASSFKRRDRLPSPLSDPKRRCECSGFLGKKAQHFRKFNTHHAIPVVGTWLLEPRSGWQFYPNGRCLALGDWFAWDGKPQNLSRKSRRKYCLELVTPPKMLGGFRCPLGMCDQGGGSSGGVCKCWGKTWLATSKSWCFIMCCNPISGINFPLEKLGWIPSTFPQLRLNGQGLPWRGGRLIIHLTLLKARLNLVQLGLFLKLENSFRTELSRNHG